MREKNKQKRKEYESDEYIENSNFQSENKRKYDICTSIDCVSYDATNGDEENENSKIFFRAV